MRIQSNLERLQIVRDILSNLEELPEDLIRELRDSTKEEFDTRQTRKKPEDRVNDVFGSIPSSKLYNKKDKITIDALPVIEQNLTAERIFADKLGILGNIILKLASNVRDKHYFSTDLKTQKECIMGVDAFIEYLRPLYDDSIAGDWKDLLDPLSHRIRWQKHWSEDQDCVRDIRYQIFEDGEVKMRHKFTNEHAISGSMLLRLYNIVKITDCSIFASGLFMNNLATRYQQAEKARKARYNK